MALGLSCIATYREATGQPAQFLLAFSSAYAQTAAEVAAQLAFPRLSGPDALGRWWALWEARGPAAGLRVGRKLRTLLEAGVPITYSTVHDGAPGVRAYPTLPEALEAFGTDPIAIPL